jgi:hypothetical protein
VAILGSFYGSEFGASATDVAQAAATAGAPFLQQALTSAFSGETYDAFRDYLNAVARSDAKVPSGATNEETLAKILSAGWVPIYCSNSEATRDAILTEFELRGWVGKTWYQRYQKGILQYTHWYGATFKLADAPPTLINQAVAEACRNPADFLSKVGKFITDAKSHVIIGGVTDWPTLMKYAVPVTSSMCAGIARAGATGIIAEPLYKKWWFWAAIGTVVVTSGVTGYFLLRKPKKALPAAVADWDF